MGLFCTQFFPDFDLHSDLFKSKFYILNCEQLQKDPRKVCIKQTQVLHSSIQFTAGLIQGLKADTSTGMLLWPFLGDQKVL